MWPYYYGIDGVWVCYQNGYPTGQQMIFNGLDAMEPGESKLIRLIKYADGGIRSEVVEESRELVLEP